MRSKASFKSHPIHPILIAFPIAFFIGAFLSDVLAILLSKSILNDVAFYLCIGGVIGGFLAAIPGVIDYIYTVPPKSSAKKRATKHALLNVTNLLLFIFIIFYKQDASASQSIILVSEGIGVTLLSIAGWMGGTLVYRNQIGVDPRYAFAGKWKEEVIEAKIFPIEIAHKNELQVNQMKLLHVNKHRVVVGRTELGYVAFNDYCTHRGGSLAGGAMICGTIQCPWHGSQFDVVTGLVKAGPADEKIITYATEERNGKIYLINL